MSITVGILGAGQLAQMLSVAARHLHLNTLCLAKDETCCAALVSDVVIDPHRDATLFNRCEAAVRPSVVPWRRQHAD